MIAAKKKAMSPENKCGMPCRALAGSMIRRSYSRDLARQLNSCQDRSNFTIKSQNFKPAIVIRIFVTGRFGYLTANWTTPLLIASSEEFWLCSAVYENY